MKAIILAGGAGTRLQDIVKDIPKPMVQIAGKPFLEYLILQLAKNKLSDIILAVGYKKEVIKKYFDSGQKWNVNIAYCEEKEPLGTGGAIKKAATLFGDKDFLVMNGDSFLDIDFHCLVGFHKKQKATVTLGLASVEESGRYGKVEVNKENEIVKFTEKGSPGKGIINGGVYVFSREAIQHIPQGKSSLENDILSQLISRGLYGMITEGFFVDIGLPRDYLGLSASPHRLLAAIGLL